MVYKIIGACDYKKGNYREKNEDNFYFSGHYAEEDKQDLDSILTTTVTNLDNEFFAVFDGVGGEAKGERASYIAAKTMYKYKIKKQNLDIMEYIQIANNKILANTSARKMATTLCLIHFDKNKVWVCNLGDSRVYLLRNNTLRLISVDHTDENITKKLHISDYNKPKIMQYLGLDENELTLEPSITELEYKIGDKYLLCTDGLTDFLINKDIQDVLLQKKSPKELVSLLMTQAQKNNTKDNATIEVFEIKKGFSKLSIICFVLLLFILLLSFFLFSRFKINDQCQNLIVGESCLFQFDDKKYTILIEDTGVVKYQNNQLIANKSGTTYLYIKNGNDIVYEKEIKVFPDN